MGPVLDCIAREKPGLGHVGYDNERVDVFCKLYLNCSFQLPRAAYFEMRQVLCLASTFLVGHKHRKQRHLAI